MYCLAFIIDSFGRLSGGRFSRGVELAVLKGGQTMTDLEGTIQSWEHYLEREGPYLIPSVSRLIEKTIKHLKQLQEITAYVHVPGE